jgi:hypothetical protein
MPTAFSDQRDSNTRTIGAANGDSDYVLWQYDLSHPAEVYFEYDDQANGGYDIVRECHASRDGCHIVLRTGELVHIYWSPPGHPELKQFVSALRQLYRGTAGILDVCIS